MCNRMAEAAYMTSLERNGDVVRLASYAPLLAKQGHTQWRPDMIYFDNTNLLLTANYYVQQIFGQNGGDVYLSTTVTPSDTLAVSCVQDSKTTDIILKLVNVNAVPATVVVNLKGHTAVRVTQTVLAGDPQALNTFANPRVIFPTATKLPAGKSLRCEAPASSLTVLRLETK